MVERLVEKAARELGQDPAEFRKRNYIKQFPHQTPVIMTYDAGDYAASLDKALETRRLQELRQAQARERPQRQAARHRLLELHRGLRHRAVARRSARSAPAWACGNRPKCASTRPARSRCSPARTATARATRPPSPSSSRTGSASRSNSVNIVHGDTDKVQFGMGTYGSRSGAVGMSAIAKAIDKVIAKGKKVAAYVLEASEGDIEFKDGKFGVAGTDRSLGFGEVALQAYIAHKFSGQELEPGLKEGAFYDPTNFTFPAGVHICEVEIDPETGIDHDRALDGGGRFRRHHQPDDRRGPGAWRHRSGRRPGAARRGDLRQVGPARDGELHGLPHAARRATCRPSGRHDGDALPVEPARDQGLRRGRGHRRARRRSSTPSPTRSAMRTSPCRQRRRPSGAPRRRAGCRSRRSDAAAGSRQSAVGSGARSSD